MSLKPAQRRQLRELSLAVDRFKGHRERMLEDKVEQDAEAKAAMATGDMSAAAAACKLSIAYKTSAAKFGDLASRLSLLRARLELVFTTTAITVGLQSTLESVCSRLTAGGRLNTETIASDMDSLDKQLTEVEAANEAALGKLGGGELAPDTEVAEMMARLADEQAMEVGASLPQAVQELRVQRQQQYASEVEALLPMVPQGEVTGN